jgi:uncharacterized protein YjbI with pentapeptide repeats
MANDEDLARIRQGTAVWNPWRAQNRENRVDLRNAYLSWAELSWADLRGADLRRADLLRGAQLRGANLSGANFRRADLGGADLQWAVLFRANLSEADLTRANFRGATFAGANLVKADLQGANLRGTNFTESKLNEANFRDATTVATVFANIDLSGTRGLDSCYHMGPSSLDYLTLQRSGPLPLAFLRGCGLPDRLIDYLPSLLNEPIQYYSCFISYSSKDGAFAERLHADLQNHGVRCWFAPEDMKIGEKFRQRIDEAIHVHERLLLILSENSVSSEWVEKEVETAFEKEQEQNRTVLFPLRLDDTVMESHTGWSADIRRTRHIGDFRRWKDHDAYQQAFNRVLRDLKAAPG